MTDPTTRAQWRAEAADPDRGYDVDWAPRVIALCDELTALETVHTMQKALTDKAVDRARELKVKVQGDEVWIAVAVESNKAVTAYLRSVAPDIDDPGSMPVDHVRRVVEALREDAALLDGLISLADNRQDLVLSHDLVSHDPDVLEWSVELTDGRYFSADNPRDAIRAALAQARDGKP